MSYHVPTVAPAEISIIDPVAVLPQPTRFGFTSLDKPLFAWVALAVSVTPKTTPVLLTDVGLYLAYNFVLLFTT